MLILEELEATFGKLDGEILRFAPGLNIITAPNEWGKSTWCAFLMAMLYGVETRSRTTKTEIAEKERYAPWSGKPMSGRMDAVWNGRKIRILRSTAGRIPMGVFQAVDRDTGMLIPELTGQNCGQMLIGVERAVFSRSAFIRQGDMPVGDEENLRRRLHSLVTTGEDRAASLPEKLRQKRNEVRYRRTGLLPQAEQALEEEIRREEEAAQIDRQTEETEQALARAEARGKALENHLAALAYGEYQRQKEESAEANARLEQCRKAWESAEDACRGVPEEEVLLENRERAWALQRSCPGPLPVSPAAPEEPMTPEVLTQAEKDAAVMEKGDLLPGILGAAAAVTMAGAWVLYPKKMEAVLALTAGLGLLILAGILWIVGRNRRRRIAEAYGGRGPGALLEEARSRSARWEQYCGQRQAYEQALADAKIKTESWQKERDRMTGGVSLQEYLLRQDALLALRRQQQRALEAYTRQQTLAAALGSRIREAAPPEFPDTLTGTEQQTALELSACRDRQKRLSEELGVLRGKKSHLSDRRPPRRKELEERVERLRAVYRALNLAIETAEQTEKTMSERFAPCISRRAGEYLSRLTGGRYDTLRLQQDMTLLASAQGESVLRGPMWRSAGTADQFYLSLRLAVAQELIPQVPLVLDDALCQFDDARLKAALELLKGIDRQVILFSCQSREKTVESRKNEEKCP